MYCSSCGEEVDESASYCPECGYELQQSEVVEDDSKEVTESTETTENTDSQDLSEKSAPCQKCGIEIPIKVDRCSYCGYEPSSMSLFTKILATICVPVAAIGGFLLIMAVYLLISGEYTFGTFILAVILFGTATGIPAFYLNKLRQRSNKKPTDVI